MFIAKDGFGFEANNFGVGRGLIVIFDTGICWSYACF